MTPILFYGVPEGCSFGSIVALEWTGAPYRLCRVEMPAVVSSEAYKPVNPIGETPSLMLPDGRVMSESMAILNHIAARTVGKGWGFDPKSEKFDRLNQMLAFLNTAFFNAFGPLWHAVEHELDPQAKQALRTYGIAKVEKAHAQLETLLGGREWLLGDEKSFADAYFAGIARWNDFHQVVDRRQFPGLNALYERLQQDPAVRFAWAIEHQEEALTSGQFLGHVSLDEALGSLKQAA
ncbi:glutathione S-transferase family protein [Neorhizobium sp. T25_13]|uniref:glutathione S-transferase family protein n=1 Tax=Neorhizobium sp. T25_13 TaxID=2093830 RepID=UPI000CF908F5|nr:glutathione S-transferase family protein [Neorhizobium sp. T25_13]